MLYRKKVWICKSINENVKWKQKLIQTTFLMADIFKWFNSQTSNEFVNKIDGLATCQ